VSDSDGITEMASALRHALAIIDRELALPGAEILSVSLDVQTPIKRDRREERRTASETKIYKPTGRMLIRLNVDLRRGERALFESESDDDELLAEVERMAQSGPAVG